MEQWDPCSILMQGREPWTTATPVFHRKSRASHAKSQRRGLDDPTPGTGLSGAHGLHIHLLR